MFADRQLGHAGGRRARQHDLARYIRAGVIGRVFAALARQRHHVELAFHRETALNQAGGDGIEVAQDLDLLALRVQQAQAGGFALPLQEAGRRPEARAAIGREAADRHLQPRGCELGSHVLGRGAVARAGLDAVVLADGRHVAVGHVTAVGAADEVGVGVRHTSSVLGGSAHG